MAKNKNNAVLDENAEATATKPEPVVYEPATCVLVKTSGSVNTADDAFTHTGDDTYELMSEDMTISYGKAEIKPDPGSNRKIAIFLPKSPCNRKLILLTVANKHFATNDTMTLEYKASKHIEGGARGTYTVGEPLKKDAKLVGYLTDEQKVEYQAIVDRTIETYNAQKPVELTDLEKAKLALKKAERKIAELKGEEYVDDTADADEKTGRKTLLECMSEEDYLRYDELLTIAGEAKAKAPRAKVERKPLSKETQIKMAEARKKKAEETIARLLAGLGGDVGNGDIGSVDGE